MVESLGSIRAERLGTPTEAERSIPLKRSPSSLGTSYRWAALPLTQPMGSNWIRMVQGTFGVRSPIHSGAPSRARPRGIPAGTRTVGRSTLPPTSSTWFAKKVNNMRVRDDNWCDGFCI